MYFLFGNNNNNGVTLYSANALTSLGCGKALIAAVSTSSLMIGHIHNE